MNFLIILGCASLVFCSTNTASDTNKTNLNDSFLGSRQKTDELNVAPDPKRRRTNSNDIIPIPEETAESRDRANRFRIYQHERLIRNPRQNDPFAAYFFGFAEQAPAVEYTIDTLPDYLYRNAVDYNKYLAELAYRDHVKRFYGNYVFDREAWEEQSYY